MNLNLDKHYSLLSAIEIDDICQPLKILCISHFTFTRLFKDGSKINLCNNASWLKHYYDHHLYAIGTFEGDFSIYQSGYTLWSNLASQQVFCDGKEFFHIANGITILQKHEHWCDFFHFGGTPKQSELINFYLNNIDLLERFNLYFLDKAADIIERSFKSKIISPLRDKRIIVGELRQCHLLPSQEERKNFIKSTSIRNYRMQIDGQEVVLSQKEITCLKYLMQGLNSRETSNALFRSKRTIETHLYNAKMKLGCDLKSELVKKLLQSKFQILTT